MILHLTPKQDTFHLKLDMSFVRTEYEHYKGEYIINPKITLQELECKEMVMNDNVTVNAIYYNETENKSGGLTAQIGEI